MECDGTANHVGTFNLNYTNDPGRTDAAVSTLNAATAMAKILTVDDSKSIRQMVAFTLRDAGHDVTEAEDGQAALDIAQTSQFDLVLSDINMPRLDGIGLIKALRALPSFKFTPILTLTTESGRDLKEKGKAAGATGWIVKPFDPEKLLATIKKVLG